MPTSQTVFSLWFFSKAVCLFVGFLSASLVFSEDAKKLNVLNWNDYIAPQTIDRFEQETGVQVNYQQFDNNESLEQMLLDDPDGFDLVVPSADFMARQLQRDFYSPIDKAQLSNYKYLDPQLLKSLELMDPGNRFSIPYLWGTTGIAYNSKLVEAALGDGADISSWSVLFAPELVSKLSDCGVAFLDSPSEVFPVVLNYLGRSPNSRNSADYRGVVQDLLVNVAPHVKYFHSSDYIDDLANGKICVAMAWSGDVFQAIERASPEVAPEIRYIIPNEGAAVWVDVIAIPKQAKNKKAAHAFIDFLLRPKVIAEITNYVSYANPNLAADLLVKPEVMANKGVYPSDEVRSKLYVVEPVPSALQQTIERTWYEIKAGAR